MAKAFAKFTKVEIVDKNGDPIIISVDGKLKIEDDSVVVILKEILTKLDIISLKLNVLSEDNLEIDSGDNLTI